MSIKSILPLYFLCVSLFAQQPTKINEELSVPREKIHVEGLKTNYLAGEKLSVKFSVIETPTLQFTSISVPLYVELIESLSGKLLRRFVLKIEKGGSTLNYRLPLTLKTANYQIRAYTTWMRNFPESSFFNFQFPVFGQNYKEEMGEIALDPILDTIGIYAEGGQLTAGIKNKVLLRTFDNFGVTMEVPFKLKNENNDIILESQTDISGGATFEFHPNPAEKYFIESGSKVFEIQNIKPSGTNIIVDNLSNKDRLRVMVQSTEMLKTKDPFYFIINQHNQNVYLSTFENKKDVFLFFIDKNILPEGILDCYLIKNTEILASRTIYNSFSAKANVDLDTEFLTKKPENFFYNNRKFLPEKGLSIGGTLKKVSGKELKKEETLTVLLADTNVDSIANNYESIFVKTKGKFKIDNLDFYGKKRATFVCPLAQIEVDSLADIPLILTKAEPINWKMVSTDYEMQKRKDEIIEGILEESKKSSISLEEIVVKAKKNFDPFNKFGNASPQVLLDNKDVVVFPQTTDLIEYITKYRCGGQAAKVIINGNLELTKHDNLLDFFIGNIEKVEIFRAAEAAIFNCNCAINVVMYGPRSFLKEYKQQIIEGYYTEK
ncbi:hypothetical protein [Lacihabitans sp. CCS-44]|uniref:hypothetical protein n=1 Tax=Lacihabitans sp. CCS-44 TaxID=2487331 RepID=UPI0020CC3679|nr:hypothetical protein [Lacihabitans sp. CCS-44]